MRNKISLIFLFFSLNLLVFAQNSTAVMEVNYEMKYASDSLNKKNFKKSEFTLLLNSEESLFFDRDCKDFYEILNGKKEGSNATINTSYGAVPMFPKNKMSIHRLKEKTFAFLSLETYIFHFEEPELKWEILNETKDINGYKCQLAKTITDGNDTFFAWFTNDIAFQEGPHRFKGLSGLILEVYNQNKTIEISATEIKKSNEKIELILYLNVIQTNEKKKYLKARANYIDNPSIYNNGLKLVLNGQNITYRIRESLQKINVFLD